MPAITSELAPGAGVEFRSIDAGFDHAPARDRVLAGLAGGVAMLALLPSIGLYGVMSSQVLRRRQEFGGRVAIGAALRSVMRLILTKAV